MTFCSRQNAASLNIFCPWWVDYAVKGQLKGFSLD